LPICRAGFIWDDDSFLVNNQLIHRSDGLLRFWFSTDPPDYFPLTSTTLWLEWRLWGMSAFGYHLTNLLLHGLSAVLWWRVLARLRLPCAWLAAAIFAVHPVNVESVAWITERKNTLAMLFYVLTLLCYEKHRDSGQRKWYGIALASFALSLLSKTAAAPLPIVLLGVTWWRNGLVTRKDWLRIIPFFVLALVLGLVTVWFQSQYAIGKEIVRNDGFVSRLAVSGWAVWFYLYKALLPLKLAFAYPRWHLGNVTVLSFVPLALLLLAGWVFWRQRERWGRGWFVAAGYFVVMLLPVIGFVDIYFMKYSLVADHWQYFAMIAIAIVVAAILHTTLKRWGERLHLIAAASVLLILMVLTWRQALMYANIDTLWRTTLAINPNSYLAHINLGNILLDAVRADSAQKTARDPRLNEAIAHYHAALQTNPNESALHHNLGTALWMNGDVTNGLIHVRHALELEPKNARVHFALGNILLSTAAEKEATEHYRQAVELDPYLGEARLALGSALFQRGELDESAHQLKQALKIQPDLAQAHNILGQILQRKGQVAEAMDHLQMAVKLNPKDSNAQNNLGTILFQTGQSKEAIGHLNSAVQLQPNFAEAHYNLGNALSQIGQIDSAIQHLDRAQQIQPENASAHNNLGGLLLQVGRTDEAVAQFEKTLQLRPGNAMTHNNLGRGLLQQGKPDQAGAHFLKALEIQQNFPQAADNLRATAWVLATSPKDEIRNGSRAVELACQLGRYSTTNTPLYLGTLAAAYAEARQFSTAAECARRARELAGAATNSALANDLDAQLALYQAGMSLHDSDRTNAVSPRP
jgi:Flp pilus assembly protein TadD